jgi:hypothetical protein
MIVSDNDLELIEASLDGDTSAADAIAGRIAAEPALADALADAMADAAGARESRREFWDSLTPTEIKAEQFAWKIRGEVAAITPVKRPAIAGPWWMPGRIVRYGSVAAACIVFGFYAGRARDGGNTPSMQPTPPTAAAESVLVPISDDLGQPAVFQKFKSVDEARQFEAGLHQSLRSGQSNPVQLQPVSDNGVSNF